MLSLTAPSSITSRWLDLPIATTNLLLVDVPQCDSTTARETHNTLIYSLTASNHCTLPDFYLHDPSDPSPPLRLVSSDPAWVERQSITYALARCMNTPSRLVGIHIEYENTLYMIAVFSLDGHLFLPLSKLFPQPLSANLYCSVQLSNAYNRLLLLTILLKEVHPFLRHGDYYTAIVDYIHALSRPMWFFDELDDTDREQHLEDIDFYVDIMSKRFTSLCKEREEDT